MHSFQSCFIFVCSGFLFVCVVYTIKSDFYEMSPLAKVKWQDVPDFGEIAFKSHDASAECVSL